MSSTPVAYESSFKVSELYFRKVNNKTADGTEYSIKLPCFQGTEGLEVLFAVINHFTRAAKDDLHLHDDNETPDYHLYFTKFKNVLNDSALIYWETEVIDKKFKKSHDHNEENWNKAMKMMKRSYAGGHKARDTILEYLSSSACRKTVKTSVEAHVRRIVQLVEYANDSEGEQPQVTPYQRNLLIVKSLPLSWQDNWTNTGQNTSTATESSLIAYFSEQKNTADRNFRKRTQSSNTRDYRGGKRGRRFSSSDQRTNNSNYNKSRPTFQDNLYNPNEKCPIHIRGSHTWGNCRENKRSTNFIPYVPPRSSNSINQSRGGAVVQQGNQAPRPFAYRNRPIQRSERATAEHHYEEVNDTEPMDNTVNEQQEHHAYDMLIGNSTSIGTGVDPSATSRQSNPNWFMMRPDQPHQPSGT